MHRSIILVVGARPNFVKVAPLLHALTELDDVRPSLLHTGQHYDWALSQAFIEQLGLPEPEDYLGVGRAPMPSRPRVCWWASSECSSSGGPTLSWWRATELHDGGGARGR